MSTDPGPFVSTDQQRAAIVDIVDDLREHPVTIAQEAADEIERLRRLLADVATAASRISTPTCDDGGFHHCCGGTYGCKSDCAVQQVQALVRHDLRPYVRPLGNGSSPQGDTP